MRWAELGFSLFLIVYQVVLIFPRRARALPWNYVLFGAGALLLVSLLLEGYRWQMLPGIGLFLVQALYLLVTFPSIKGKTPRKGFFRTLGRFFRTLLVSLFLPLSIASLALLVLFPLPVGDRPGGLSVSTRSYRLNLGSEALMVRLWYPALPMEGPKEPQDEASVRVVYELFDKFGLPLWFEMPLSTVISGRTAKAPFQEYFKGNPVIYFLGGPSLESHTYLLESLASWGFLVVACEEFSGPKEAQILPEEEIWKLPAGAAFWHVSQRSVPPVPYRKRLDSMMGLVRSLSRSTESEFGGKIQEKNTAALLSEEAVALAPELLGRNSPVKGVGVVGSRLPDVSGFNRPLFMIQAQHRADLTDDGVLRPYLYYYGLRSRLTSDLHRQVQLLLSEFFKVLLFQGDGSYLVHGNKGFPELDLIYRPGR